LKVLEASFEQLKASLDDSGHSDLSRVSSSSSLIKKSKKFLHFPKSAAKKAEENLGKDESTDGKPKTKSPKIKNFLWNPLFGEEFAKKHPK
jgi:hypothetical protein